MSVPIEGPGSFLSGGRGRVLVEARLQGSHEEALRGAQALGAELIASDAQLGVTTFAIEPRLLDVLARVPQVRYLTEVLEPATSGSLAGLPAGHVHPQTSGSCPTGILSEGDAQLNADDLRTAAGVNGANVRIGVLSDSYDNLAGAATDVANAELPGSTNPCGNTLPVIVQSDLASGGSDEGRAMAQIVHDLAPGAELAFASAFKGELDFAQQVSDLATNGADVIVDDIIYFSEPMFQEGPVAKAMSDAVASGVPVFSSAGNSRVAIGGKPVTGYDTPAFRPTTCPAGIPTYNNACHDFDPGAGTTSSYALTLTNNGNVRMSLGWNEPQFGVATDLDWYLLDASNAVVAKSESDNAASGKPFEFINFTNTTGVQATFRLVVGRYQSSPDPSGTPRFKHVLVRASGLAGVGFDTSSGGDIIGPTLFGHAAAASVFATGATPYNNANAIESFSTTGPAHTCWEPVVGSTPAAPLPGGCISTTVAATATDGTANSFFGSLISGTWRFYGTSAAAPHAAAVAGLLREAAPCRTPGEITAALEAGAVDLGFSVDWQGAGRIDAFAAHAALTPCVTAPNVTSVTPNVGLTTGGQTVTIEGEHFGTVTAVRFGQTPAASFVVVDSTTITAVTPSRPEGLVNVWVENPAGTNTNSPTSWFNFQDPPEAAPTVTSLTPNIGTVDGGTEVTIKGTGFLTASSVRFGPSAQASFTIVNDTTIVAITPPHAEMLVNVWVTNPNGTNPNQPSSWYSYRVITGPAPTVTSVAPNKGTTAGGTSVTITGTGLTDVNQVKFGSISAASFVVVDDATITAITPAHSATLVNTWVISQNGKNGNSPSSWYRFE